MGSNIKTSANVYILTIWNVPISRGYIQWMLILEKDIEVHNFVKIVWEGKTS